MWSVWLVFCDCGFHSVCPLTDKDKRLVEASWGEILTYCPWIMFILSIFLVVLMGMEKDHHSKPGGDKSLRTWQCHCPWSHCPSFWPVESDTPRPPPLSRLPEIPVISAFSFRALKFVFSLSWPLSSRKALLLSRKQLRNTLGAMIKIEEFASLTPMEIGKYLFWLSERYLLGVFLTRARKINEYIFCY